MLDPLRVSTPAPVVHGVRVLARLPLPISVRVAGAVALVLADEHHGQAMITSEGAELVIRGVPRPGPEGSP